MRNDEYLAVSSRARLARNLFGIPFSRKMSGYDEEKVLNQVREALSGTDFTLYAMKDLDPDQKRALMEKHLISPDLMKNRQGAAMISRDERISVMIGEEDHLRIQSFSDGLSVEKALSTALQMDELLGKKLSYAQDRLLGYLTACPTNVGTGLRVSVMLHLPALTMTGRMRELQQELSKHGIAVRGMYGEGSAALGQLYQLSNSVTLGITEENIAKQVKETALWIMEREEETRAALMRSSGLALSDRMGRAYGILRYARSLSYEEFMGLWSDCMMGAEEQGLSARGMKEILNAGQPSQLNLGDWNQEMPVDARRAEAVRNLLVSMEQEKQK